MIILASSSQRRIELLKDAGVSFEVIPSDVSEDINLELTPEENAMLIAKNKALDVFSKNPNRVVLAADTLVVFENKIFGKPESKEEALEMLKTLNNETHHVITGVAIISKTKEDVFYSKASVTFKNLLDVELMEYVETGEVFGKAGAYAIQGLGKKLVETYTGDFFTIVGLPLKEVLEKLELIKNAE